MSSSSSSPSSSSSSMSSLTADEESSSFDTVSFFYQFRVLFWKQYLQKSRDKMATLMDVFLPIVSILTLLFFYSFAESESYGDISYFQSAPIFEQGTGYTQAEAWGLALHPLLLSTVPEYKSGSYNAGNAVDAYVLGISPATQQAASLKTQLIADYNAYTTKKWGASVASSIKTLQADRIVIFTSDAEVDEYVTRYGVNHLVASINLDSTSTYTLRANVTNCYNTQYGKVNVPWGEGITTPTTFGFCGADNTLPKWSVGAYPFSVNSYSTAFSSLQLYMNKFMQGSTLTVNTDVFVVQMPAIAFDYLNFNDRRMKLSVAVLTMLFFAFLVDAQIGSLVEEKQSRVKETLKIMGMRTDAYILAFFAMQLLVFIVITCLILLITVNAMYKYSDKFIIFLSLVGFLLGIFGYGFLVSTFFTDAKTACFVGSFLWSLLTSLQYNFDQDTPLLTKMLLSLLCPGINFIECTTQVYNLEEGRTGVHFSNWGNVYENWNIGMGILLQYAAALMYILVGLYVEEVLPGEYGVSRPWHFVCTFCCASNQVCPSPTEGDRKELDTNEVLDKISMSDENSKYFEASPSDALPMVTIRNLTKAYAISSEVSFTAVKGLNLDLFKGQLFSLLGQNGAGKTSLVNMMTGLFVPSSGDATMNGLSISRDMHRIRRFMGVCPQHDILSPLLTPTEMLSIVATLKGVTPERLEASVNQMLKDVGLHEKRDDMSKNLSGGQKRKLSVACAFIGDSKIVFLDEPTAGMDVHSKRAIWALMTKMKQEGRVVVLVTHNMDEAELGDRIAIMTHGVIRCCGSSLFLKNVYGVGYTLSVTKTKRLNAGGHHDSNTHIENKAANAASFLAILQQDFNIANAVLSSNNAAEVSFRLPFDSAVAFSRLFERFDKDKAVLGIDSYGISVTTLTEVFLRISEHFPEKDRGASARSTAVTAVATTSPASIAEGSEAVMDIEMTRINMDVNDKQNSRGERGKHTALIADALDLIRRPAHAGRAGGDEDDNATKCGLFCSQFPSLLNKRFISFRRDTRQAFGQVVLPSLFFLFASLIWLNKTKVWLPTRALSTSLYSDTVNNIYVGSNSESASVALATMKDTYVGYFSLGSYVRSSEASALFVNTAESNTYTSASGLNYNNAYTNSNKKSYVNWSRFLLAAQKASSYPIFGSIFFTENPATNRLSTYVFFNPVAPDTTPSFVSLLDNVVYRGSQGIISQDMGASGHPLNKSSRTFYDINTRVANLLFVILILIGFSIIPQFFGIFIVKEKMDKAKHLQVLSGVDYTTYWLATLCWDMLNFIIPSFFFVVCLAIFGINVLVGDMTVGTILVCVFYGPAVASFSYMMVQLFDFQSTEMVQRAINILCIIFGILLYQINGVIKSIAALKGPNEHMMPIWRYLFPPYTFAEGLANIADFAAINDLPPGRYHWYDWEVAGQNLCALSIQIVVYFGIVIAMEHSHFMQAFQRKMARCGSDCVSCCGYLCCLCLCKGDDPLDDGKQEQDLDAEDDSEDEVEDEEGAKKNSNDEDADVTAERQRIIDGNADKDVVVVRGLSKVFGQAMLHAAESKERKEAELPNDPNVNVAVHNLYFGIPEGQCFGFLGMNGAGKTTSMRMLCGDEIPTNGSASLNGFDILTEMEQCRKALGYCPQFDALFPLLSPREHLALYATIKYSREKEASMKGFDLERFVDGMLHALTLEHFADKPTAELSGGNRRKLSVGIALIGSPPIVFLDEPTTGMDPQARRFVWTLIESSMENRAVILTTHLMEECEALCSRIGIMIKGKLSCLGTAQHLKEKYGNVFCMEFKLKTRASISSSSSVSGVDPRRAKDSKLHQFISAHFPDCRLLEVHDNILFKFQVQKRPDLSLAQLFSLVETNKEQLEVDFYSISETDLEFIFIRMAKMKKRRDERKKLLELRAQSRKGNMA